MTRTAIIEYIKTEMLPLILSIPDDTLLQQVDNVVRYFNAHSAHRLLKMFDIDSRNGTVTIDNEFKNVLEVLPSKLSTSLAIQDPTWTLLGIQSLNYMTSDLITVNEAYKGYSAYFGADFQWHFEAGQDPSSSATLYLQNLPAGADKVAVIGAKRILPTEDITSEHILDWVLSATMARVKMVEGNVLRKADIIGIKNDGENFLREGKEEWDNLKEQLRVESRWFAMSQRM